MPKKMLQLTKRGRIALPNNPPRPALKLREATKRLAMPVSEKEAKRLAGGVPLPRARGVHVRTAGGSSIIRRDTKKGAICYKYALV